jgi:aspartyl-tRNA(Asn)/glutamyl-tRNA(Gln) amidotransferase subunit C
MGITPEEVEYIASLSRMELTGEEKMRFREDLDAILAHTERLLAVNTEGVEPTAHILPVQNVWREDAVKASMEREEITADAPEKEDGCFIVPKTVE